MSDLSKLLLFFGIFIEVGTEIWSNRIIEILGKVRVVNSLFGFVITIEYIIRGASRNGLIFLMRSDMFTIFHYTALFGIDAASFLFSEHTMRWSNILRHNVMLGLPTDSGHVIWGITIHWLNMTWNSHIRLIIKWPIIQLATLRILNHLLSILGFGMVILSCSINAIRLVEVLIAAHSNESVIRLMLIILTNCSRLPFQIWSKLLVAREIILGNRLGICISIIKSYHIRFIINSAVLWVDSRHEFRQELLMIDFGVI